MQESFFEYFVRMGEVNPALVILPIITFGLVLVWIIYQLRQRRKLATLKESDLFHLRREGTTLGNRVRIRFNPAYASSGQEFYYTSSGSEQKDISGTLYLLKEIKYADKGINYRMDQCALINWKTGEYVIFIADHLEPKTSFLKYLKFKKWIEISTFNPTVLYVLLIGLIIYAILLTVADIYGFDADQIFLDLGTWGYIVAFGVLLIFSIYMMRVQEGHYAHGWYVSATNHDVYIPRPAMNRSLDEDPYFIKTDATVFYCPFWYHEDIRPLSIIGDITASDVANKIDRSRSARINHLEAENKSIRIELAQLERKHNALLATSAGLKLSLETRYMEGVAYGLDLGETTRRAIAGSGQGLSGLLGSLQGYFPLILVGIFGIVVYVYLPNVLSNLSLDPSIAFIIILVMIVVVIIMFLIAIMYVYNNFMRPKGVFG